MRQLSYYFECLADSLWEAGIFKSQQEARSLIYADFPGLLYAACPGGFVPDDEDWPPGPITPDEIAQGIVSLRNLNEFVFQAPVCKLSKLLDVGDFTIHAGGLKNCRLTSKYADLSLVKMHPELAADKESEKHLWIEGSVEAHRYDVVRGEIDRLIVSVMGVMEVIGLLRYVPLPGSGLRLSMGIKDYINSGAYYDMHSLRISQHLEGLCDLSADNEIDRARTMQARVDTNLRTLDRVMSDMSVAGLAVRHACRMYLRAYESWSAGESAMFLAITMEGLMLDKRQKDDLSPTSKV